MSVLFFLYGAVSNLLSETTGQSTTVAYAHPSTTSYAYDALNRQTQEIDAVGVAGVQRTTSTVYDAASNVVQSYDALGNVTSYTYDALNQQITEQTLAGGTATTVYDAVGNVLAQIDQLGHATSYTYDALNRQITETDGDRNTTTCAYDAAGNQISLTDADNNTTTMVYDALNRQISETDPLNHTSTAVYDAANNLISTTDRDGRLETFSYDTLNRKTGATWIVSASTTNMQTFTYDAVGNQLSAADYHGAYTMAYDALNRMTSNQEPFGQALTYSYDTAGNQIQLQDSQGGTTTSVYNALDELTTREFGGTGQTPLREDLTYTALGQIATETRYTDLAGTQVAGTSSYVYDTDDRLTNLTQTYANGSVLASYVYNYNQISLLTSEVDDGVTTSYSYDNANQLTQGGTATYGYDATGNRTNTGYQTGPDNQLLSDGTYSYTYDNEGNLETKQAGNDITTYSYDNQNQLSGAIETVGGTLTMQATYVYDVFGNLLETDEYTQSAGMTTITRSAYDGSNPWADLNGSNVLQMRYVHLDGQNQMLARVDSSGNLAWYGTDHLGSVRDVINGAGTAILDHIVYDAYGNITSETSPTNRGVIGYAAYRWDAVLNLYYVRARWLNPVTGRFITQDPIVFKAGDPDLYRYVMNNPTNGTDPVGLDFVPNGHTRQFDIQLPREEFTTVWNTLFILFRFPVKIRGKFTWYWKATGSLQENSQSITGQLTLSGTEKADVEVGFQGKLPWGYAEWFLGAFFTLTGSLQGSGSVDVNNITHQTSLKGTFEWQGQVDAGLRGRITADFAGTKEEGLVQGGLRGVFSDGFDFTCSGRTCMIDMGLTFRGGVFYEYKINYDIFGWKGIYADSHSWLAESGRLGLHRTIANPFNGIF